MSKKISGGLTKADRAELSARVKTLRQSAGWTQAELADLASTSRQTINNMEGGTMVPQEEVLVRVLRVLGLDVDEQRFNPQTELWLSMMGTLIEAIPDERRAPAVDGALRVLGDGLKASNVVPANDTDVLAELPVLSREESKKVNLALAAQERQRKRDAKLNDDHA